MAIVRKRIIIYEGDTPTPEQIEKLKALENRPIVYDEDCPELTAEQIAFIKDSYGEGLVYDEDCPPSTPAQLARYQRANPRPFKKASL